MVIILLRRLRRSFELRRELEGMIEDEVGYLYIDAYRFVCIYYQNCMERFATSNGEMTIPLQS